MAWLTGYNGWSFCVHQGDLVFHDEDPIWWGRRQDAQGAYRTVSMADDRCASHADGYVPSTERHPLQDLAALIREKGFEPGLAKNELLAEIYSDAIRGVPGAWGDDAAIVALLPSGTDAAAPHPTWDGRPFERGEATFYEMSGCYRRYHAPLCRTVFLGKPPAYLLDAENAVVDGLEAGLDAARPGARAGDIASAFDTELKKAGIVREGRCGYPIGLSYPPDWGERTISFRPSDETVLQAGMTFHFMPGLWMDDWGLEITESILISEQGAAECLCDRPRQPFVKD